MYVLDLIIDAVKKLSF